MIDRKCARCQRPILNHTGRGQPWKYCPECLPIARREKARDRKRKQRQQAANRAEMMAPLREVLAKYRLPQTVNGWHPGRIAK